MSTADHRRRSRQIAPATVTARDGEIVVVVPDVLGKNESHRRAGAVMHTSTALKRYRASVSAGAVAAGRAAIGGAWRLEVIGVWPNERHDVGFAAPLGDVDAAIPQALDALMAAGILDDDGRVVEVRAWNLHRRGVRATIVRLTRVSLDTRDIAMAHLYDLVPVAIEKVKPARKRRAAALAGGTGT
jgi:Holliday junction resolvase RusA-like endonuclease